MAKIIVIGAGAAGMMAAITAARNGKQVVVLEKNDKPGKKLFITGKGRCNVTNACDLEALFENTISNPKFLYSAIYSFDNQQVMQFFEKLSVPLKTERGDRVFPQSDHSSDIIRALVREMDRLGVEVIFNSEVVEISLSGDNGVSTVKLKNGKLLNAKAVILSTGGKSYPLTGSTGSGFELATKLGHTVTPLYPALVPLKIKQEFCKELMGLSLKNVTLTVMQGKRQLYHDFGEMLFTHYGISGPLVLSASSHITKKIGQQSLRAFIDLKPALSIEQLDKRILREFEANVNKQFKNTLGSLFPSKLIPVMIQLSNIAGDKKINEISKEERMEFVKLIKGLELEVVDTAGFQEAIITQGGINVKEINPSTMESKIVKGLYFAGEIIDLDAMTGGYNLQIAWSSGFLAGESAALQI